MINREDPLPLTTQCKILNLSRSGIYYVRVAVSDKDRELMNLITWAPEASETLYGTEATRLAGAMSAPS